MWKACTLFLHMAVMAHAQGFYLGKPGEWSRGHCLTLIPDMTNTRRDGYPMDQAA